MLGRDLDVGMGWLGTGAACFTQLFATKGPGGRGIPGSNAELPCVCPTRQLASTLYQESAAGVWGDAGVDSLLRFSATV